MKESIDQLLADAERRIECIVRDLALRIVRANRLRDVLGEERATIARWEQKASDEAERGDSTLAEEALRYAQVHAGIVTSCHDELGHLQQDIDARKIALSDFGQQLDVCRQVCERQHDPSEEIEVMAILVRLIDRLSDVQVAPSADKEDEH